MANTRSSLGFKSALVVLMASLAIGLGVPKLLAVEAGAGSPREPAVYVVQEGDTLWKIAAAEGQGGDPRKYVYEVKVLNRLSTSEIFPGQKLTLPG